MNSNDKKVFAEMWSAVREDVYGKPVSNTALSLIFNSMQRFDIQDIQRGIEAHINDTENGQFPITPTHVIANIEGRAQERGAVAWRKLVDAVKQIGPYEDVVFDDAAIHSIIHGEGGWQHICTYSDDDMKFFQARFIKQYTSLVSRRDFDYPRVLKGITNLENEGQTYADGTPFEKAKPVSIGNVEQARLVYKGGTDKKTEINGLPHLEQITQKLLVNE